MIKKSLKKNFNIGFEKTDLMAGIKLRKIQKLPKKLCTISVDNSVDNSELYAKKLSAARYRLRRHLAQHCMPKLCLFLS
jgi:hypothetical protein